MLAGLNFWKNGAQSIALDPDNVFWAINPSRPGEADISMPSGVFSLYEKVREKLDKEIKDFRFGRELTAIYIDPTDMCNAQCSYCYIPAARRRLGRSMSAKELDLILAKLAAYFKSSKRKQVIIFHAAEPLLVKEVIFAAIKKYKKVFNFGLQTNAILLEKEDVDFLKKHRVGVGISLDASVPSVNNRLRPHGKEGGNFSKAVRAIEWFDGYSGLNVIATITGNNIKEMPGLVRFLHKKRVPCVLMNAVRFTRASIRALKQDDGEFAKYFIKAVDTAVDLTRKTARKIIIGNFANTVLAIIAPEARRLMCDISPCGGGRCFFTITADGQMIPCGEFVGLKGFSGGNIFKDPIDKAMRSKAFARITSRSVEKIPECSDCTVRNICGAPCPAELHSLGNMYQKSVFCDFYKEIIRYAFKMISEGNVGYLLRDGSIEDLEHKYDISAKC